MKINEIKAFLKTNPQYYLDDNNIEISDIKTDCKYHFKSDCGHDFVSRPCDVISNWKIGCPICSNNIVKVGVNDFNTVHNDLTRYLYDYNDGFKYTSNSKSVVKFKCPHCGFVWEQSIYNFVKRKNKCKNCCISRSYPERFLSFLLDELCVIYESEVLFEWSDNKRYDFYLPEYNIIIEVHGRQHYNDIYRFSKSKRRLIDEEINDKYKEELAKKNGINEYIIIDASQSDFNWIKTKICESLLPTILMFSPKDIDWSNCDMCATDNSIFDVCDDYNNCISIRELVEKYKKSYNTIVNYLNIGNRFGWCNYDAKYNSKQAAFKNGQRLKANNSKPVLQVDITSGKIINEFSSIREAQKQTGLNHIGDCASGKRNKCGGYKWIFK